MSEISYDDIETDSFSEAVSDSSEEENLSICNEIQEAIERANEIHSHFHTAVETLELLHGLVKSHNNIYVIMDGVEKDFDEALEELHTNAISTIYEKGVSNFSEKLLAILNNCEMK